MTMRQECTAMLAAACVALFVASDTLAAPLVVRSGVTVRQIEACVRQIGRRADYTNAVRVMHWVSSLDALNYAELEVKIETSIYVDAEKASRIYKTRCVSDTLGTLTAFSIDAVQ